MTYLTKGALASSCIALAACGGTSTSGTSIFTAEEEAARVFAEGTGDAGDVLSADGTLSTRAGTGTGITLRFGGGTTNLTDAVVTVRRNAAGEATMTLNGVEHAFTADDRKIEGDGSVYGYAYEDADRNTFDLYSQSDQLDELLTTGNGYSIVVSAMGDLPDGDDTLYYRAFAALGAETQDDALTALTGTATYNGYGRIDTYPTSNFQDSGTDRNQIRGDVTMTANFDDGAISGYMDELTLRSPGSSDRNALAGQIDFGTASFEQNTYSGSVAGDAALAAAGVTLDATSNYSGAFFGPDADEVSGVITATGALNGTDINAIGYFTQ